MNLEDLDLPRDDTFEVGRHRMVERVKVKGAQAVPTGLVLDAPDVLFDILADAVVIELTGYVLGERGPRSIVSEEVDEPRFPSWLPRWLRRRWTGRRLVEIEVEPLALYANSTTTNLGEVTARKVVRVR